MAQKSTFIERLAISGLLFLAVPAGVCGQQSTSLKPSEFCRSVIVLGAVRAPSRFEFRSNVRLTEVITCAGGLSESAGKYAQILHMGQWKSCSEPIVSANQTRATSPPKPYFPELYKLEDAAKAAEKNPVVQAGDIVSVLEFDAVYVTGGVVAPQAIYLKPTLTLTQAIDLAGGLRRGVNTGRIRILRQTPESPTRAEVILDLKAIRKRRAEDPVLQPFDIIEVPETRFGGLISGPIMGIKVHPAVPFRAVCEDSQFLSLK